MKKQHHEEHAEGGEEWLMSYADLITVLLAVFVLLFSMSTVDSSKAIKVTTAISQYLLTKKVDQNVAADVTLVDRQLQALRLLTTFLDLGNPDEVLEKLLTMVDKPKEIERLRALSERMGIMGHARLAKPDLAYELNLPVQFLYKGKAAFLSDDGVKLVRGLAPTLREVLQEEDRVLEIQGHTDSMPISQDAQYSSNNMLAAARAEAVALLLIQSGIPDSKIQIVGKGSSEPLYEEKDAKGNWLPQAQQRNQRVTLAVKKIGQK
jgi:chemotaxis protein MotB